MKCKYVFPQQVIAFFSEQSVCTGSISSSKVTLGDLQKCYKAVSVDHTS